MATSDFPGGEGVQTPYPPSGSAHCLTSFLELPRAETGICGIKYVYLCESQISAFFLLTGILHQEFKVSIKSYKLGRSDICLEV